MHILVHKTLAFFLLLLCCYVHLYLELYVTVYNITNVASLLTFQTQNMFLSEIDLSIDFNIRYQLKKNHPFGFIWALPYCVMMVGGIRQKILELLSENIEGMEQDIIMLQPDARVRLQLGNSLIYLF